jgi:hypothetical protein
MSIQLCSLILAQIIKEFILLFDKKLSNKYHIVFFDICLQETKLIDRLIQ